METLPSYERPVGGDFGAGCFYTLGCPAWGSHRAPLTSLWGRVGLCILPLPVVGGGTWWPGQKPGGATFPLSLLLPLAHLPQPDAPNPA